MKASKSLANYVDRSPMRQCRDCEYYRSGACTLVEGKIAPQGSCRWFEKMKAAPKGKK